MPTIVVSVLGQPKPAGSKRAFLVGKDRKRAVITDDTGMAGRDWRVAVQHAITLAYGAPPLTGPLELTCSFTVVRPRGHAGRRGLRPSAPAYPSTRPDLTKLLRAVEDAATGLLWVDDAQIVSQTVTKRYGTRPGVTIHCRPLDARLAAGGEHAGLSG
jgi:Holliday junction resolvase RusA-like endonuclease